MRLLGLLLLSVAKVFRLLINFYTFVVGISVLVSWVNPDPYNPIVRFLYQVTSPIFSRVRRILPQAFFRSGFDPTPLLVVVALIFIDTVFVGLLFEWAANFLHR